MFLATQHGEPHQTVAEREDTPLPFVYVFLSSKEQVQYKTVLQAVKDAVAQYQLPHCVPQKIMTDFEKGIINAAQEVFPEIQVACCFFHLGQSVYRQVQDKSLQQAYNDPDYLSVKKFIHKLLALAYVPIARVQATLEPLVQDAPKSIVPILDYFKKTYVASRPARGSSEQCCRGTHHHCGTNTMWCWPTGTKPTL